MSKAIKAGSLALVLAFSLMGCVAVVRTRPPETRFEARPSQPYADAVWIEGYWQRRHGDWVWIGGHWERKPRGAREWVPGQWVEKRQGWEWKQGHWRH
jgi:hypothetical protein